MERSWWAVCREILLGDNVLDHVAVDIRQPEVTSLVSVRKPSMIDSQLVQDGGV